MNILFLLDSYPDEAQPDHPYALLADEFSKNGHKVYMAAFRETSYENETILSEEGSLSILRMKKSRIYTSPVFGPFFQPGYISRELRQYFKGIHFDLILSASPSSILPGTISRVKKEHQCPFYLLLRGLAYETLKDLDQLNNPLFAHLLKKKESLLYEEADWIGCISPELVKFLGAKYSFRKKLDYVPNWQKPKILKSYGMRDKLKISHSAKLFVFEYSQEEEMQFLIEIAEEFRQDEDAMFIITGELKRSEKHWIQSKNLDNIRFLSSRRKEERDGLLAEADIGLILLHRRLGTPVVPAHAGDYLNAGLPILASENPFTHFSYLLKEAACGLVCYTGNLKHFRKNAERLLEDEGMRHRLGVNAKMYVQKELSAEKAYETIMGHFEEK
ncbi:glycosyltransferase family 4 protein [Metabacillus sp. GX 13764]|uniref:glycosyltransferase family 4 protein n=1 Tax=Metabacillus kandeliae TaxID=2900151 RepID=UPI001E5ADD5B|nr:glycosyltransferase family 4 protein [Metabacillus kandeliae]MCD7034822.1 glycosyltransferase family 4 protein [Metabacillus kandeliae]